MSRGRESQSTNGQGSGALGAMLMATEMRTRRVREGGKPPASCGWSPVVDFTAGLSLDSFAGKYSTGRCTLLCIIRQAGVGQSGYTPTTRRQYVHMQCLTRASSLATLPLTHSPHEEWKNPCMSMLTPPFLQSMPTSLLHSDDVTSSEDKTVIHR